MNKKIRNRIMALMLALSFPIMDKGVQAAEKVNDNENQNNEERVSVDNISNIEEIPSISNRDNSKNKDKDNTKKNDTVSKDDKNVDEGYTINQDGTSDKKIKTPRWEEINNKLYYLTKDGVVAKSGWFKEKEANPDAKNDNEYYLNDDHSAVTGWKQIEEVWYYFDEKGVKQTGWQTVDGNTYYLGKDGVMQKGWIEINDSKFYLNDDGAMAKGKTLLNDVWYSFDNEGHLKTGFYINNGKTYYSNNKGEMITDQWIEGEKNKYYIKSDGTLAFGDIIIDGKLEKFDDKGKYIGEGEIGEYLYVEHLSVRDADCAFIKLPNGETALIDTGDVTTTEKLLDFLNKQDLKEKNGKKLIDYVLITHAHSDHIGGLVTVLNNFEVNKVYMPETAKMQPWHVKLAADKSATQEDIDMIKFDYEVFARAESVMRNKGIEFTDTVRGEYMDSGKILQFVQSGMDFGGSKCPNAVREYWTLNENSAVVYLNYGDLQELFTGDLSYLAEAEFTAKDLLDGRKVDVLKVGHHGNDSSSTMDFINYLNPVIGVVSRSAERIVKNVAYNDLIANGTRLLETSKGPENGVAIYATKDNWSILNN